MFNMNHPCEIGNEDEDENENSETEDSLEKEAFAVKTRKLLKKTNWISVSRALNAKWSELDEDELKNAPGLYKDRVDELRKISDYRYRTIVIPHDTPYAEVVKIFVRVNSQGTTLKGADLALAKITAKWPSTADEDGAVPKFKKYIGKLKRKGHEVDISIAIRNLVVSATNQASLDVLPNRLAMQKNWEKAEKGMNTAIDFVTGYVGLENLGLLSSPACLITIAKCFQVRNYKLSQEDKERLKLWAILANLKGRYALGASVSRLSTDLGYAEDIKQIIQALKTYVGRLEVEPSDLSERTGKNNSYLKMLYVILKEEGAKDWFEEISVSWTCMSRNNKLEAHHIFPRAQLSSHLDRGRSKAINNIANLAFITSETNRRLRDRLPEDYLPEIKPQLLEKHLIPSNPDLWKIDNYSDFLKERQRLIAEKMNSYWKIKEMEASLKE